MNNNPRVSVVTPSYNQAPYLEQTIQSVLQQSYPNIEYMVLDGGSADRSVEIIKKNSDRLAYWHSEKDRGASDAVNQGWKRATGEIFSYLNSDDLLLPGAVATIVEKFTEHPEVDVVYGDAKYIDARGDFLEDRFSEPFDAEKILTTWEDPVSQPAAFFRRRVFTQNGGLNESFHFCFDFEYWMRIYPSARFLHIPLLLAAMRLHDESKTAKMEAVQADELLRIGRANVDRLSAITSIERERILKGLHLRVSQHFRNSGARKQALENFSAYCWKEFPPWLALYRIARFTAGMLLK